MTGAEPGDGEVDAASGNERGEGPQLTIRAMAERTGLSTHTLRAWELRYGVPSPARSEGRYRLYSYRDLRLVQHMVALVAAGVSPGLAARQVLGGVEPSNTAVVPRDMRRRLLTAAITFDEGAMTQLLRDSVELLGLPAFLEEIAEPFLVDVGRAWQTGSIGIDVEHFASTVVRTRVDALVDALRRGRGPRVLLACPAGERHDLPLHLLQARLVQAGWRPHMLGADVPQEDLLRAVTEVQPDVLALSVTYPVHLEAARAAALAARAVLPGDATVLMGGQGVAKSDLPPGVQGEEALVAMLTTAAPNGR